MQKMTKGRLIASRLYRIISLFEGAAVAVKTRRTHACVKRIMKRMITKHQAGGALTQQGV
jgi:hypothetical protein